jgi:5S rRNA maturation endonuclease (ribonuclease M5)
MKKIIILSDTDKPRYGLVSHLKKLFPECKIQILPRRSQYIEECMSTAATVFNLNNSEETAT